MRNLTSKEYSIISGAGNCNGTLTVSAKTFGAAIDGPIDGVAKGVVTTIVGRVLVSYQQ